MGTKSKVLSEMIKSSVHGIETGRPILFFNTANVEMVYRVLNDEDFSSHCPELLKTEHGWTAMGTDRTNPQRMRDRLEGRSNYRLLTYSSIGDDINKLIDNSLSFENAEPPQVLIIKTEYSTATQKDILWENLVRFLSFYAADHQKETPIGRSVIILYGTLVSIPDDFIPYCYIVEEAYPEREELTDLVKTYHILSEDAKIQNTLIDRLKGFALLHVERLLRYIQNSQMSSDDVLAFLSREKEQFLKKNNLLELIEPSDKKCCGMEKFEALISDMKPLLQNAEQVKLDVATDSPKGILLCGIPGTGKSVAANMFASETKLPMVKMDIGRLMGSYVGESEHNMANALKLADALAPCIVFIDELDKGFEGAKASSGSNGSDTVFRRMFASLLGWMQEHKKPCFIFATANDISNLPKEFFRSGRFDCMYAVQMPTFAECKEILIHHMDKRNTNGQLGFRPEDVASELMNFFVENKEAGRSSRFVTGADIEKIVEFTVRALWSANKRRNISSSEWAHTFQNALDHTTVYGDSCEQRDSIAMCYIRLLRNNFEAMSDNPLISHWQYQRQQVENQDAKPGMLPEYRFEFPGASFTDEKGNEFHFSGGEGQKIFDNRYDFELYKMICESICQYAPVYERNALNKLF